ncbi:hypothetical protein FXN61_13045 [Lentzea sp. PSKA42]|uniref:Uncharacterized protein n=1 Tax=Lentzea indica TaxID=2604800 RepID=A0ABX1FGF6_9PSEU|nr:hypothetical protein [Lentzea indica]NKE57712.1 hypothetical protein [Lentzea indica]
MSKWHVPSDNCLICSGAQEIVIGIRERGPYERMHDYARVLFCAACDVGELRAFSYDDFVVFGEEDDVMVWSSVLVSEDVDRLRSLFACASPLNHQCECAQHVRAYESNVRANKTLLPEYGPDRHTPVGRTTVTVELVDGLAEFR